MKRAWTGWVLLFLLSAAAPAGRRVELENIRYYAYPEYTRVVLDLSGQVKIQEKKLQEADRARLFFDLKNCRFAADYPASKRKEIRIESGNLKGIRLGGGSVSAIRVVFDFDRIGQYSRFYLTSPFRIVFDIYRGDKFIRRSQESPQPAVLPAGSPSVARQLGLSVHRIVLDPGHGGRDPGTINSRLNMTEKEITLDVALRLKALLAEHPELETILTRSRDEYLSLEERTAIANSSRADLFISIHANSAPRKTARGVETFYLSLTTDAQVMQLAARENASNKSMGEIRDILDQIIRNSNVEESRILSDCLQRNTVSRLRRKQPGVEDLGVRRAPFFVLVGAQMPASLIEVSFLSSRAEAERLADPTYRQTIADGLHLGIVAFIQSLKKT